MLDPKSRHLEVRRYPKLSVHEVCHWFVRDFQHPNIPGTERYVQRLSPHYEFDVFHMSVTINFNLSRRNADEETCQI